ncbi:MAG: hypothetical protein WBC44_22400 [Planctomycetaceae bacterium]
MADFEFPAADATEQDLIRIAQNALSRCNWVVGRCAADWTQRYSRGRTDADFAQLVGLSADQVYQRRRVWETFGDVVDDYPSLRWSHFYIALNWDDAPECLQWADENGATVAETRAWRRAMRGEELDEPAEESTLGDDPSIGRLGAISAAVRDPDEDGRPERSWSDRERDRQQGDDDVPFVAGTVLSANRETAGDGSDYAPFRKDAGSTPPGETREETAHDDKPAGQIAKRVISTLERIVTVLTPQIVAAFRSLPDKDRQRLVTAVQSLADRVTALEKQHS